MFQRPLLAVLTVLACAAQAEATYQHPVNVVSVELQDSYQAERRFSGRAVAARRSALAFELPGTVDSVRVETGDPVRTGDVLVELDTRLLKVQQAEVEAALAENQATLDKTERDLKRQRSLQNKGYSAQQAIDDLQANRRVLLAQRDRLQAQARGVALRLEKSVLKAPYDGEVLAKAVDTGVIVKEGQPALEVAETRHIEAVIGIPEVSRPAVGTGETVTVRGPFGETRAEVLSVTQTIDPNTLTHSVRLRFPDTTAVADGSIVYMLVNQSVKAAGSWLPLSALLEGYRGTWAVYAVDESNILEKRSVKVLYQAGERVYVSGDLNNGAKVVADGVHRFAAGQQVQVAGP